MCLNYIKIKLTIDSVKSISDNKYWQRCGEKENLCTVGRNKTEQL